MLHYLNIAVGSVGIATSLWIVGTYIYVLTTETGTWWERLLKAARDSATILWAKFGIAVGAMVSGAVTLSDAAGDPQIGTAIQKYLTPDVAGGILVAAMVVTVIARKRTL